MSKDIERFYDEVEVGTLGELVYEPIKVAVTNEGKMFVQVDRDVYGKIRKPLNEVTDRINDLHMASEVDWDKIRRIVQEQDGIAEDVTLFSVPSPQ